MADPERKLVSVHEDYLAALKALAMADREARSTALFARMYVDACKTIAHLERCLRKTSRKAKTQHRELKRLVQSIRLAGEFVREHAVGWETRQIDQDEIDFLLELTSWADGTTPASRDTE